MSAKTVPPRRIRSMLGDWMLTALAAGGLICIVLVGLAFFFDVTLMMFKTGSMSPTIPAGSVALVREIPASEIQVGDVVTVDRAGILPVTHRVTSVQDGAASAERTITMRGDANPADDPAPYTVTDVRIVMGSVPALASVIVWSSHPFVLGSVSVVMAGLVTWAFWPREPREGPADAVPMVHPEFARVELR
jgi:signal peptidase